jgi:hypothetical protein
VLLTHSSTAPNPSVRIRDFALMSVAIDDGPAVQADKEVEAWQLFVDLFELVLPAPCAHNICAAVRVRTPVIEPGIINIGCSVRGKAHEPPSSATLPSVVC